MSKANGERSFYKSTIKTLEPTVQQVLEANQGVLVVPRNNRPCSSQGRMHYSSDYVQQVHYPSNPVLSISKHSGNVVFLLSVAKPFLVK